MDIKSIPMVRLSWDDARDMETGWLPIKDMINAPLAKCQEVGWMIVNNKEKVVVMRSWCVDRDDNHGGGAIAIPTRMGNKN
jgi:hypothetical protein